MATLTWTARYFSPCKYRPGHDALLARPGARHFPTTLRSFSTITNANVHHSTKSQLAITKEHPTPLAVIIRDAILSGYPLTISQYMSLCLTHPRYGYYTRQGGGGGGGGENSTILGSAGDFTTSPEISPILGESIAARIATFLAILTREFTKPPSSSGWNWSLMELGPGRGTLMADVLRTLGRVSGPGNVIPSPSRVVALELSSFFASLLRDRVRPYLPQGVDVEVVPDLEGLVQEERSKETNWIIYSNEFFDALPTNQYQCVQTNNGEKRLDDVLVDLDPSPESPYLFRFSRRNQALRDGEQYKVGLDGLKDGDVLECSWQARNYAEQCAVLIRKSPDAGLILIIDYPRRPGERKSTLRGVRGHRKSSPLSSPGTVDLSVGVDFQALGDVFTRAGLGPQGPVSQRDFILGCGMEQRVVRAMKEQRDAEAARQLLSGFHRITGHAGMGSEYACLSAGGFYTTGR